MYPKNNTHPEAVRSDKRSISKERDSRESAPLMETEPRGESLRLLAADRLRHFALFR
jgi:hypothetical protein